jgi:hypothetical protein
MQVALCNQVDRAQRADVGPVSAAVGVSQFAGSEATRKSGEVADRDITSNER